MNKLYSIFVKEKWYLNYLCGIGNENKTIFYSVTDVPPVSIMDQCSES